MAGIPKRIHAASRLRLVVRGLVQGVGFRPFVYRLATSLNLPGWVRNSTDGVHIELEGDGEKLAEFVRRLRAETPPHARIDNVETQTLALAGYSRFTVQQSDNGSADRCALILPDIATCGECVAEIVDPANRRFRYPFTNCTNCGPRFSIIESLPYDRANTTMRVFPMCDECREEYENPENRRFHAQPNACPNCGPHLELWEDNGAVLARHDQALLDACALIRKGSIVALKGLGGFQLLADAGNDEAVQRLRQRKARRDKPFALMYPAAEAVGEHCLLSKKEQELLLSSESPIVLLRRGPGADRGPHGVSRHVAPGNPYLGAMLPYTPLHHLLLAELQSPIIATSGNRADEPICIDERDALARLRGIADFFLVHNRPIARQMDDSIVQFVAGREMVLRSARGYAPATVQLKTSVPNRLAVGAHLKNTVAVSSGRRVFMSQHIGDLTTKQAHEAFTREAASLAAIYDLKPQRITCDQHPDYHSTAFAADSGQPVTRVQHHFAHVLSCMAEYGLQPPVLGVSWDGTGLGTDGTIWGGEFLRVADGGFERVAHLRPFSLPGGDKAAEEPRRSAIGVLYEIFGDELFAMQHLASTQAFRDSELEILRNMLQRRLNTARTSSAGRLFDAVASITDLCQMSDFEGQAAMALQFAAEDGETTEAYDYCWRDSCLPVILDWQSMIRGILQDVQESVAVSTIAAKYHRTLMKMILAVAGQTGIQNVILTGGCFQNRLLAEQSISALRAAGFEPYWHQRIPANDGGIALGQIYQATICPGGGE